MLKVASPRYITMIDFIGIGGQRSGTSWIYACLYEHPAICAPIKEIHFFSRPRYEKGVAWYLSHFKRCGAGQLRGEFSTSYLYSPIAAERIKKSFPSVKIIACLRNPVTRAFSQYRNAIAAGEIGKSVSFEQYLADEKSVVEQGFYYSQVNRYRDLFPKDRLLVLIYEDSLRDPAAFVKRIYEFLGVDASFAPSLLHRRVNTARTPRLIWIDRTMIQIAEALRRAGFDRLVWVVKKSGVPQKIRQANTEEEGALLVLSENMRRRLASLYRADAERLSEYMGRNMAAEWGLV